MIYLTKLPLFITDAKFMRHKNIRRLHHNQQLASLNEKRRQFQVCFFCFCVCLFWLLTITAQKFLPIKPWKEYFPNLLETALLHQIFVYWVRGFKLWLLAFFLFPLSLQSFIRVPPFEILVDYKIKKHQRGDPYKMYNINVVQSC